MNETIKATIDINITNQTANNSISPTVLGNTMKSVVDDLRPCKVYKAFLNQSGTSAPIPTIVENTLGNVIWSRYAEGSYEASLTGIYVEGKTVIIPPTNQLTLMSASLEVFAISGYEDTIDLQTGFFTQIGPSSFEKTRNDNLLNNHYIEIRVYE